MTDDKKEWEMVGKDLKPTGDMQVVKFDLGHIVQMRDFLSAMVKMTVQEDQYSLVLAAMGLLVVEAVAGQKDQAHANLDNTIDIYNKLEELRAEALRKKLESMDIPGEPS